MSSPLPSGVSDLLPRTEAQRKRLVLQSARAARRQYRRADTAGELLERWLDRQIARKTRIMPAEIQRGVRLFQAYFANVRAVETVLTDVIYTASQV